MTCLKPQVSAFEHWNFMPGYEFGPVPLLLLHWWPPWHGAQINTNCQCWPGRWREIKPNKVRWKKLLALLQHWGTSCETPVKAARPRQSDTDRSRGSS